MKQNLRYLNTLNDRWGLYRKSVFCGELLSPCLRALFGILLSGSHGLLLDDVCDTVATMVTASEKSQSFFYQQFLPECLQNSPSLTPDQAATLLRNVKVESSQPSLAIDLQNLVGEIKLYELLNTSAV